MKTFVETRKNDGLFYVTPGRRETLYDILYIGKDTTENVFWFWKVKVEAETEEELNTTLKYIISDPDYDEEGSSQYGFKTLEDALAELKLPDNIADEFRKKLS